MAIERVTFRSEDRDAGQQLVTVVVWFDGPHIEKQTCNVRFWDDKNPNETNAQEEARHLAKAKAMAAEFAQS